VWATRLQLLTQQLTRLIAIVEAVREVDELNVRAARYGSREVSLARLARHIRELDEAHALAEVLVSTHTLAQLLQPERGRVDVIAVSRLAPALVGVDLLELAIVDGVNANAVVSGAR
jgi:hypothetical protein